MKKPQKPTGITIIKPIKKKIASWIPQTFDASAERCGIVWLRVKDGMSGRGDREDWVADVPYPVSVHDYHWNGDSFGKSYGSFDNACFQELKIALLHARAERIRTEQTLAELKSAVFILEEATRRRK